MKKTAPVATRSFQWYANDPMGITHRSESFPGTRDEKRMPRRRRHSRPHDELLPIIRNLVISRRDSPDREHTHVDWVTLEEISEAARARHGEVQKVFYQLVREGILNRAVNQAPHDSTLPGVPRRGRSGWQATRWTFRK